MTAREHLAAFDAAFSRACAADAPTLTGYSFAGLPLRCRVVGGSLSRALDRPFLPMAIEGDAKLRLDLWDDSAGVAVPRLTELSGLDERGGPAGERLARTADGLAVRFSGPAFALWLHVPERRIVGWIRSADVLSPWHRYRPFQPLLGPWLAGTGRRVVHAAAVATEFGAVLLCGPNGAGKSTCAMACIGAGMQLLGDDVVAIGVAEREVHTLYTVVKVREQPEGLRPSLAFEDPLGRPEWVIFLRDAAPHLLRASAPLAAIAFPSLVDEANTRTSAITPGAATRILLPADQMQDPDAVADLFEECTELVNTVPTVQLHVGRQSAGIAAMISALVSSSGGG